jgi:hypothetical protein
LGQEESKLEREARKHFEKTGNCKDKIMGRKYEERANIFKNLPLD